jgi:hypothetical protein
MRHRETEGRIIKIFVASLLTKKPYKAYAVFNGITLVVQAIVPIKGDFRSWKDELIAEIEKRKKAGFVILVEEKTNIIASHATQFMFTDKDGDDRINYYSALDWYFAISNIGNLILPKDGQQYTIHEQNVDPQQDEQGRIKYNINWDQFNGGHRCVLMCIMAAMFEPVSEQYIDEMFRAGSRAGEDNAPDHLKSLKAITIDYDIERGKRF